MQTQPTKHNPHFVNINPLQLQQMSTTLTADTNQHIRSLDFCFTIKRWKEFKFVYQDFYLSRKSDCRTVPSSPTDQTTEGALSSTSTSLTRPPCVQINPLLDSASTQFGVASSEFPMTGAKGFDGLSSWWEGVDSNRWMKTDPSMAPETKTLSSERGINWTPKILAVCGVSTERGGRSWSGNGNNANWNPTTSQKKRVSRTFRSSDPDRR